LTTALKTEILNSIHLIKILNEKIVPILVAILLKEDISIYRKHELENDIDEKI
jgi:hypothetical protein